MNSPIFSSPGSRLYVTVNWIARSLTIAFAALLVIAWWDETRARQDIPAGSVSNTDWFYDWAIFTHVLPALCAVAVLIIAWRKPLWGFLGFLLYASVQIFAVGGEWIYLPFVAGPPLIIATVYLITYFVGTKQTSKG